MVSSHPSLHCFLDGSTRQMYFCPNPSCSLNWILYRNFLVGISCFSSMKNWNQELKGICVGRCEGKKIKKKKEKERQIILKGNRFFCKKNNSLFQAEFFGTEIDTFSILFDMAILLFKLQCLNEREAFFFGMIK